MKNPRKNERALSEMLPKLRFADRKNAFRVFFPHEVPILAGSRAWGLRCDAEFPKIRHGLPSATAC
jgi:hypothetical protein